MRRSARAHQPKSAPWFAKAAATLTIVASASQSQAGGEIYEFYNGVRSLGMGGTYAAVVNDETALLTNPAALGRLRDYFVTVADPEVELGAQSMSVADGEYGDTLEVQPLLTLLNGKKGKHYHLKAQAFPSLVLPNFGIGILAKYTIDGAVNAAGTEFDYNYRKDFALAMGYNFRLFDGIVKLGFNGKIINRVEVQAEDLDPTRTDYTFENLAAEGMGVSTDIGLLVTAPVRMLPTLGAVVRDAGGTTFTLNDGLLEATGDRRPARAPQKVDAGLSLSPVFGKWVRMTMTGELHDVTDVAEEEDIMRRIHAGIELNLADFMFFRVGMNQRYWSAGAEFATEQFQLQAATYGEEITPDGATTPKEDRRYVGKFSLRF